MNSIEVEIDICCHCPFYELFLNFSFFISCFKLAILSQTLPVSFGECSNTIDMFACVECVVVVGENEFVYVFVLSLIGSNLSSTGAMPSSPVRSFRLISSICSCTEMKRVRKRKRGKPRH